MAPVTEVVLITLKPDADYSLIAESARILARQPGCLAVRTSRLRGEPDKVHYFIDWVSVGAHLAFARDAAVYAPFRALVGTVMAGFAPPYHVVPLLLLSEEDARPADVLGGAAALVGKAWVAADRARTPSARERASAAFGALLAGLRERAPAGYLDDGRAAAGWSVEEAIAHRAGASRVFFFAVGWDGAEACARFRASRDFGEVVGGIRGLEGMRELEVCVVCCEGAG
ncbi:hypothetical protein F4802DRAFT_396663 [Xylaria palmicola]|nr:hypothetical protein F4802DRAFT_396663 [Xylaria palmicola]